METVHHKHKSCFLRKRFEKLWSTETLCDVTLVCKDGTSVLAHFLLLAVHSEYFQQQLSSMSTTESEKHFWVNVEASPEVVNCLLKFLYTGTLILSEELVCDLEKCATELRFYDVIDLLKTSRIYSCLQAKAEFKGTRPEVVPGEFKDSVAKNNSELQCGVNSNTKTLRTRSSRRKDTYKADAKHIKDSYCKLKSKKAKEKREKASRLTQSVSTRESAASYRAQEVSNCKFYTLADQKLETECNKYETRLRTGTLSKLEYSLESTDSDGDSSVAILKTDGGQNHEQTLPNLSSSKSNGQAKSLIRKKYRHKQEGSRTLVPLEHVSSQRTRRFKLGSLTRLKMRDIGLKKLPLEPLSWRICLQYRLNKCTRRATVVSLCQRDNCCARSWKCCQCSRVFTMYSLWTFHYRSLHLAYLSSRLKSLKNKRLLTNSQGTKCNRTWDSTGRVMLTKTGDFRKMPGPRCSITKSAQVTCTECGISLSTRASLKKHLLHYHNMDSRKVEEHQSLLVHCEEQGCAFANIDIQKVERHVRESHPGVKHPCFQCRRSFVRNDLLKQHILRVHELKNKYVCCICNQHFKKSCDKKIHEQQVHKIDHKFVVYKCDVVGCEYQTNAQRYLSAHKRTLHFDTRRQCPYCTTKVKSKHGLQMHINSHHLNKRPYLCEICGSGFCDAWTLQRHIAFRHSTKRDFACLHCQYATNNRLQFMNHNFQQHGVKLDFDTRKELTCPHCTYKSLALHRMRAHINHIHSDPHKYTCEICGKGFKNRHYLRDHQAIHSGAKFQCPHCEYSPWHSSKLRKHIRTQHIFKDTKPYSCPYCTYRCATSGNCRKHVAHKHPSKEIKYTTDKNLLAYMRSVEAELQISKMNSKKK